MMQKRQRTEDGIFKTNPEFISLLLTTPVERLPIHDGKIFIAQRSDKIVDVWKVRNSSANQI